jgi:vitamin B12 transporter
MALFLSFPIFLSLFFEVRGVVVDPSDKPVSGARVVCGSDTAVTDERGAFTLGNSQSCNARISKAGFAPGEITLEPGKESRVTLTLATVSDRVVVSASGTPAALEEAGVAATVITSKDMEARQYAPVADFLRDVAGLAVVQTGSSGAVTSVFSRGAGSNSALVLLDGIALTDPGGAVNLVNFTTPGLERVEVVRGPESALFGAEAASGVIQLFTSRGDPEAKRPHGVLVYERGSFSTDRWTGGLNGGFLTRLDYSLTADQNRSTGEFPNNVYRNTTGTANLGFRLSDKTTLRGIFREFDAFTGTPGATFYNAFNLDGRQSDRDSAVSAAIDDARTSWFHQRASYTYHRLRSRNTDPISEQYTIAAVIRTAPGERPGTPPFVFLDHLVPPGTAGAIQRNVTVFGGDFLSLTDRGGFNYQATAAHKGGSFTAGYEFERQSGLFSAADVSRRNNGITLFEQYSFGQRVFLSGGARVEHSSIYGARFAPRGALTFRLPAQTFLRLSLARGIKEPSLLETNSPNPGFRGNPNLHPEKTDSFEAGLAREWFGRRVRTEVSYFRNRFTDLIQFRTTDFETFAGTWFNVDKSWARGVEVTGSLKLVRFVTARGGFTKLYTRVVSGADPGQELLRRPRNSGSVSLDLTPRRWSFSAGARFAGERRDSFDPFGVTRIPSYTYAFLSGSLRIRDHFSPFVRVNNLGDEVYQEALGYRQWPRNASGGLRITW